MDSRVGLKKLCCIFERISNFPNLRRWKLPPVWEFLIRKQSKRSILQEFFKTCMVIENLDNFFYILSNFWYFSLIFIKESNSGSSYRIFRIFFIIFVHFRLLLNFLILFPGYETLLWPSCETFIFRHINIWNCQILLSNEWNYCFNNFFLYF